ncbi:transporter substrate-binding domain-containing protein [Frateuria aurantia]
MAIIESRRGRALCGWSFALAWLSGVTVQADSWQQLHMSHMLRCGVYADVAPFASPDPVSRKMAGMDVDLCAAVADALKLRLQLVPLSVESRIPELQMGRVDILVANLAYSRSRAQQISFSDAYYVAHEELIVHRADAGLTLAELRGQRISATRGSTSEESVRINHARPISYQDTGAAYLALAQFKVKGFVTNSMTAHRLVAQVAKDGVALSILRQPMADEPVAIGMRRGEPALQAAVNGALLSLEQQGRLNAIWNRWLGPGTIYNMQRHDRVTAIDALRFTPLP